MLTGRTAALVDDNWKGPGNYATVGIEVVLSVLVGLYAGHRLDAWLGSSPWLTVVGFGFGVAAAVRALYRVTKQANRDAEELDRQQREARKRYHERGKQP
jgi:ATP synthase protein I